MSGPADAAGRWTGYLLVGVPTFMVPGLREFTGLWRNLLIAGFWFVLALGTAAHYFMTTVPPNGDEAVYIRKAAAIATYLTTDRITGAALAAAVVETGWFMPGTSLALVPLYLAQANPNIETIRVYISVLVFLLWIWSLREVHTRLGRFLMAPLIVFPTLLVTWQFFSASIWGDLPAGLMLVIVLARTHALAVRLLRGEMPGWRAFAALELCLALTIYLRGNALAVALAIHIFLAAIAVISGVRHGMARRLAAVGAGAVLLAVLMAPWSITASSVLGGRVLATSSLPLSFAYSFGTNDILCLGPCPTDQPPFFSAYLFSKAYAQEHGTNQIAVQQQMAAYVFERIDPADYLSRVKHYFQTFCLYPDAFSRRFIAISTLKIEKATQERINDAITLTTRWPYYLFLSALFVVNFLPVWRSAGAQITSLAIKMLVLCTFLQPFLHVSHPRYWPTFSPLMALAFGFLLLLASQRPRPATLLADIRAMPGPERILLAIQFLYIVLSATVLGVVFSA